MNLKTCSILTLLVGIVSLNTISAQAETRSDRNDDTWRIATQLDIQGKNGWYTCAAFADDLYGQLVAAKGEAHHITFTWASREGLSGCHALVVYRDSKGNYWAMDNRFSKPVWVEGNSPQEWINSLSSYSQSKVVRVRTVDSLKGSYASYDGMEPVLLKGKLMAAAR